MNIMHREVTYEEALRDYHFYILRNSKNEEFLEDLGYSRRCGDGAYPENQKCYAVQPFKKLYWPCAGQEKKAVKVMEKTITTYYLER